MTKQNKQKAISQIIYDNLDYMYCDNCRFSKEIKEEDCDEGMYGCEDCHRKYNGWGISKKVANKLAKEILELYSK